MLQQQFEIRKIQLEELSILEELLYECIFQPKSGERLPRDIIYKPELWIYIADWGKPDDLCYVSVIDSKIIGAVWTRILNGKPRGYGNIDKNTPEFAISIFEQYRGRGIGTILMRTMLAKLRDKGYRRTFSSVAKDNYAIKLYEKVGFVVVKENEEDYIMVCELSNLQKLETQSFAH